MSSPQDPVVLSYKALRKAVGAVAFLLPIALNLPYFVFHTPHIIQGSCSAYYYTGLRNVFVGSLCAISMFMICARGYDKKDEYAGFLAALCAIGVAFCPMDPSSITYKIATYAFASSRDGSITAFASLHRYSPFHFVFATILFLTLSYFCLYLFTKTSGNPTRQKLKRNRCYKVCGWTILISLATELLLITVAKPILPSLPHWVGDYHLLIVEIACLWAFGSAWLIKGEAILKDIPPHHTPNRTTDTLRP